MPAKPEAAEEDGSKAEDGEGGGGEAQQGSSTDAIQINRAPVLTLWVAAVAQREGHSRGSALTFGKSISTMLAQSKGRSIGVFQDKARPVPPSSCVRQRLQQRSAPLGSPAHAASCI